MTSASRIWSHALLAAAILVGSGGLAAQELPPPAEPTDPSPPEVAATPDATLPGPVLVPEEPLPGDVPPDAPEPQVWTYRRAVGTGQGENVHLRERTVSEAGETMLREHSVTNPSGQHIQTWQRSTGEEGFNWTRSHQFFAPDGTPIREHEMTRSGGDPYNFSREKSMTFRDGRTLNMTQTRTWDGTSGTMERTFTGPNGQTRDFQRPWTPEDEPVEPPPVSLRERLRLRMMADAPATYPETPDVQPPVLEPAKRKWGFLEKLEKLNPFRATGGQAWGWKSSSDTRPPRAGFTIGSAGHGNPNRAPHGLTKKQPGQPEPNLNRMRTKYQIKNQHPPHPPTPSASRPHPNTTR
jgi:hypothetical protein